MSVTDSLEERLGGICLSDAQPTKPVTAAPGAASYFSNFDGFVPNADADFLKQFNKLAIHEGWSKTEKKKRRAEAIEAEFDTLYGTDTTKLEKWQELCKEVGIEPAPQSITKCKKALKGVFVNLVNLIDHRRNGTPVKKFKSYAAFRKYTVNGRIFPKKQAKEDGFIKALLQQVF